MDYCLPQYIKTPNIQETHAFRKTGKLYKWKEINLNQTDGLAFWGGETGATLLNGYLQPGIFTIYTNRNWQTFKNIELIPDENGNVEILEIFWNLQTFKGIPPLLIYADLMRSGSDRNLEIANIILNNELQYIK